MAFLNGTFFSRELARPVHYTAVLSNDCQWGVDTNPHFQRPAKNVYLLHGYSGCDTDWFTNAPLGDLANRFNINFFMPNGDNSFFLNQPETGAKYESYVGREFIEYTRKTFGLSDRREDTFIGGLSMGGFGALHTALAFPETFSKVIALSSALIIDGLKFFSPGMDNPMANYAYYEHTFGKLAEAAETDSNPALLAGLLIKSGSVRPDIFMACGTEDFLLGANNSFKEYLDSISYPVTYVTAPGVHDFVFWRAHLVKGLEWALEHKA